MDDNFFRTLFFGNYSPNETYEESNEVVELLKQIDDLKDQLLNVLDNEKHILVTQLADAYTLLIDDYNATSYSDGIKFATNFLFNALACNDNGKK